MGFGGGSGFNPSRTEVNTSTVAGGALTDTHQFTGSLDLTGSLTVNGVEISGSGGGGGGTPGGSNAQVQYNNAGSFGGSANLTFNGSALASAGGYFNPQTITTTITVPANHNGVLYGPVNIANVVIVGANSNIKIL